MKSKTALIYLLRKKSISGMFYFGFFLFFTLVIPTVIILLTTDNAGIVEVDLGLSALIYTVIAAFIDRGNDFKFFIQNGMSRRNILLTDILSNIIFSLVFSLILMALDKLFSLPLISFFRFTNILVDPYTHGAIFSSTLFLFVLLFLANTFGMTAGIFNDRFSGFRKILILLAIGMIPLCLVILFQLLKADHQWRIVSLLGKFVGVTSTGLQLPPFLLTLTVIVAVDILISYLLNRRRELQIIK